VGPYVTERGYQERGSAGANYLSGRDHLNGFKRAYKGLSAAEILPRLAHSSYSVEIAQIRAAKPDAVSCFSLAGWR